MAMRPGLAEALQNSQHQMPHPRPDNSLRFAGLKVWDGLECILCCPPNSTRFLGEDSMRKHLRKEHGVGQFRQKPRYRLVPMQTWFPKHAGGFGILWTIKPSRKKPRSASPLPPRQVPVIPDPHAEQPRLGAESKESRDPYLERTGWPRIFRKRPYWYALRQATYLPRSTIPLQLVDKQDLKSKLVDAYFPAHSEAILGVILTYQQRLFERCEATFRTTPYFLRHWLSSQYRDKPFRFAFQWLQDKGSLVRYLGYWKRLLCLLFRASQLENQLESQALSVTCYLTPTQQELIKELWGLACTIYQRQAGSQFFEEEDLGPSYLTSVGSSVGQELEEGLMELSISLLTQPLDPWSPASQHLLTYFAGIISLDLTGGSAMRCSFVPVAQSTSILSSLIWVSRLLFLEYALPQKAYRRQAWPSRETYPDPLTRLQSIHRAYMVHESSAILGELHRVRILGRHVRRGNMGRTLLFWSREDTVLTVGEQSLTMMDFRSWVQGVIAIGQQQLRRLMQDFTVPNLPSLDALSESISCREPGVSFLNLPQNRRRLSRCTQAFLQSSRRLYVGGVWSEKQCHQYLVAHDQFLTTLLLLVYLTSGQPARGPEILSTKVCNTERSLRNIVIHQGRLCLLTSYNKSTAGTVLPFYIIRFPPHRVSQLLYSYLVFIRPLVRHLEQQLGLVSPQQTYYLWPTFPQPDRKPRASREGMRVNRWPTAPLADDESTTSDEGPEGDIWPMNPLTDNESMMSTEDLEGYTWPTTLLTDHESTVSHEDLEADIWPTPPSTNPESRTSHKEIEVETDVEESREESQDEGSESEDDQEETTVAEKQGFWSTAMLTAALRQSCQTRQLSMTFTVSLYRQVAIGITKKHLLPGLQRAPTEPHPAAAIHKICAWQAGHSIEQEMGSYGLDGRYPTHLQPLLFDLYQGVSEAWHQWLEIGTPSNHARVDPGKEQGGEMLTSYPGTSRLLQEAVTWGKPDPRSAQPFVTPLLSMVATPSLEATAGDRVALKRPWRREAPVIEATLTPKSPERERESKRQRRESKERWEGRRLMVLI